MQAPRRVIPAPHQRPSISVGGIGVKREWRWVYPHKISHGDIVPSVGLVDIVEIYRSPDSMSTQVVIKGGESHHVHLEDDQLIWAFTASEYQ